MKVKIIPQRCIACGLCQTYSTEFDYDDQGIVKFSNGNSSVKEMPENNQIMKAVKECPTKALLIE